MVDGDERRESELPRRVDHASVMRELGAGELAACRFDARPFQAEAVGAEARRGEELHVLAVAVVAVVRVAAEVHVPLGSLLEVPEVVVHVVALDLVGRGRGAPQEVGGE